MIKRIFSVSAMLSTVGWLALTILTMTERGNVALWVFIAFLNAWEICIVAFKCRTYQEEIHADKTNYYEGIL